MGPSPSSPNIRGPLHRISPALVTADRDPSLFWNPSRSLSEPRELPRLFVFPHLAGCSLDALLGFRILSSRRLVSTSESFPSHGRPINVGCNLFHPFPTLVLIVSVDQLPYVCSMKRLAGARLLCDPARRTSSRCAVQQSSNPALICVFVCGCV
jgi:hypothetical protein